MRRARWWRRSPRTPLREGGGGDGGDLPAFGGRGGGAAPTDTGKRNIQWNPVGPGLVYPAVGVRRRRWRAGAGARWQCRRDAGAAGRGGAHRSRRGARRRERAAAADQRASYVNWLPPYGPTDTKVIYEGGPQLGTGRVQRGRRRRCSSVTAARSSPCATASASTSARTVTLAGGRRRLRRWRWTRRCRRRQRHGIGAARCSPSAARTARRSCCWRKDGKKRRRFRHEDAGSTSGTPKRRARGWTSSTSRRARARAFSKARPTATTNSWPRSTTTSRSSSTRTNRRR